MSADHAVKAPRRRKRALDQRLMDLVGTEHCGSSAPPHGGHHAIYVKDDGVFRVFSMIDDGGFVGIGYPDQWQVIMRRRAARMFAWWVFKMWVTGLFDLRETVYYHALSHRVNGTWRLGYKRFGRGRRTTRPSSHEEWRQSGERS